MARIILIKSGATGRIFQEQLEREKHEVVALATNQFEAVATLCNQTIEADVIVTGIGLRRFPGDDAQVSAYELGKYYQQRELPVIVVSAYFSKPETWPEEMRDRVVILTDPTLGNLLSTIEKVTRKPRFARIRIVPHGASADQLWSHLEAIGVGPENTDPQCPEVVFVFNGPRRDMFPPNAHIVWVATEETRNRAVAAAQGGARASLFTYEGGEPHEHLVKIVDEVVFIDDPNIEKYLKRIVTLGD